MKTSYGFALTAVLTLMPTVSWAQEEVPPDDPVYPFPLYHDRPETTGMYSPSGDGLPHREVNEISRPLAAGTDFDAVSACDLSGCWNFDRPTFYVPATEVIEGISLFSRFDESTPRTGSLMFGVGVNSDAGLSGPRESIRESLACSLLNPDPRTRVATIKELSRLQDRAAVAPSLRGVLRTDPCPSVRLAAARALLSIGAASALADLEHAAKADVDPRVRLAAEIAVEHIRESALLGAGKDPHLSE
jgi:hypothetical protein